jgi:hypothetical protein
MRPGFLKSPSRPTFGVGISIGSVQIPASGQPTPGIFIFATAQFEKLALSIIDNKFETFISPSAWQLLFPFDRLYGEIPLLHLIAFLFNRKRTLAICKTWIATTSVGTLQPYNKEMES